MEEGLNRHFVGRINDARHVASAVQCLVGQSQVAEALHVGLFESKRFTLPPIDAGEGSLLSFGVGESILYGQTHVGHTELSLDRSVGKLHHTVDDTLRMHHHLNLFGLDTEEPLGLHHLEPFVHHRGRVNSNLSSHAPVGVLQGLFLSDVCQLLAAECAEGPP